MDTPLKALLKGISRGPQPVGVAPKTLVSSQLISHLRGGKTRRMH
jgi:hypothetical protein